MRLRLDHATGASLPAQLITAGARRPGDRFGAAVTADVDGTGGAIGAPGTDVRGRRDAGAVIRLAETKGDTLAQRRVYVQGERDVRGTPEAGDRFGASVAYGRGVQCQEAGGIAAGAPGEDVGGVANTGDLTIVSFADFGCKPRLLWAGHGLPGARRRGDALGAAVALLRFRDDFDEDTYDAVLASAPGRGLVYGRQGGFGAAGAVLPVPARGGGPAGPRPHRGRFHLLADAELPDAADDVAVAGRRGTRSPCGAPASSRCRWSPCTSPGTCTSPACTCSTPRLRRFDPREVAGLAALALLQLAVPGALAVRDGHEDPVLARGGGGVLDLEGQERALAEELLPDFGESGRGPVAASAAGTRATRTAAVSSAPSRTRSFEVMRSTSGRCAEPRASNQSDGGSCGAAHTRRVRRAASRSGRVRRHEREPVSVSSRASACAAAARASVALGLGRLDRARERAGERHARPGTGAAAACAATASANSAAIARATAAGSKRSR